MRRFRIMTLMGLILALAVGIAALRNADELWAGLLLLATPMILCIALVGALCGRASRRAGRLGFAIFGGAYFALAFLGLSEANLGLLPTTRLLKFAHDRVVPDTIKVVYTVLRQATTGAPATQSVTVPNAARTPAPVQAVRYWKTTTSTGGNPAAPTLDTSDKLSLRWRAILPGAANLEAFSAVGHCLFALLAGLLGAAVAVRYRPREQAS